MHATFHPRHSCTSRLVSPALLVAGAVCTTQAGAHAFQVASAEIFSEGSGSTSVSASDFGLSAVGNPPSQFGVFFMGPTPTSVPFGNGYLCVTGSLTRYPLVTSDALGIASYDVDNTVPPALGKIVDGSTWNWQYWYRDPMGGGAFFNLSDALSATYCP